MPSLYNILTQEDERDKRLREQLHNLRAASDGDPSEAQINALVGEAVAA